MKELDVYMRGTVLRYDVPVVDPDAETDVYVRPSTYYIDAYINELTAKAEIGVHNVLLIYSTLLGGIVSVPTSGKATGITIKTSLGEAFREVLGTVYPVVAVSSESSPATLSKFATIESQGFQLGNVVALSSVSYAISGVPSKLCVGTSSSTPLLIEKIFFLNDGIGIESGIKKASFLSEKHAQADCAITIRASASESITKYPRAIAKIGVKSSLTNMTTERFREFKDIQNTTFGDISDWNMHDFITVSGGGEQ